MIFCVWTICKSALMSNSANIPIGTFALLPQIDFWCFQCVYSRINISHIGSVVSAEWEIVCVKIAQVVQKQLFATLPPIPKWRPTIRIDKNIVWLISSLAASSMLVPSSLSRKRWNRESLSILYEKFFAYRNRKFPIPKLCTIVTMRILTWFVCSLDN